MYRPRPQDHLTSTNGVLRTVVSWLCLLLSTFYFATPIKAADADIVVRDLNDLNFGVVPPTVGDLRAESQFCVAMAPRGRYSLIGSGSGPSGGFELVETGTGVDSIQYSVRISDRGRRFGRALRPGIAVNNLRASRQRRNGRCNPNARVRIVVRGGQLESARPGRYEGTLSLMVVPE